MPKPNLILATATFAAFASNSASAQNSVAGPVKSIVLVHGGFVDGSGWQAVYQRLVTDGYKVTVVQNPTIAADVPVAEATFMANSQVPWNVAAAGGTVTAPAWKTKPSWYLVTTAARMIPPTVQRMMAKRAGAHVSETPASHSVYISRPAVVAAVIETAARDGK